MDACNIEKYEKEEYLFSLREIIVEMFEEDAAKITDESKRAEFLLLKDEYIRRHYRYYNKLSSLFIITVSSFKIPAEEKEFVKALLRESKKAFMKKCLKGDTKNVSIQDMVDFVREVEASLGERYTDKLGKLEELMEKYTSKSFVEKLKPFFKSAHDIIEKDIKFFLLSATNEQRLTLANSYINIMEKVSLAIRCKLLASALRSPNAQVSLNELGYDIKIEDILEILNKEKESFPVETLYKKVKEESLQKISPDIAASLDDF